MNDFNIITCELLMSLSILQDSCQIWSIFREGCGGGLKRHANTSHTDLCLVLKLHKHKVQLHKSLSLPNIRVLHC